MESERAIEEWHAPMRFFQAANSTRNRKGKFLFDELFGLDITTSLDSEDEVSRNCTCGKSASCKLALQFRVYRRWCSRGKNFAENFYFNWLSLSALELPIFVF